MSSTETEPEPASERAPTADRPGSLVVLGGADGALTTIHAAARLGLRTICVDLRADAPGARAADEFLHRSTADVDGVVAALAGRPDLLGVVSPASDVNVPHQYAIATRLGLPCDLTPQAVRASIDKVYVRELCRELGLPGPAYVSGSVADVLPGARHLRWPVMVKPVDLGGGRGVVRCTRPHELADAVHTAADWSPTGRVLVEEYVRGDDLGMEAVVLDGEVWLLQTSRRRLGAAPTFATLGHDMGPGDARVLARATDAVHRLCLAIGYRRGFVNADLIATPDGEVVLIEMGARLGGNGVSELLGLVHGIDSTRLYVELAVGADVESPVPAATPRHASSRVIHAGRPGVLRRLHGVPEARALPGIADVVVAAAPGDRVEPYTQCRAKIGFVLAAGADQEEVEDALARAAREIVVEVDHDADDLSDELAS